jgi:hypothetical protein
MNMNIFHTPDWEELTRSPSPEGNILEVSVNIWNFNLHICQLGDDFKASVCLLKTPANGQSHTRREYEFLFFQRDGERYNNVNCLVTCDLFAFILSGMEKVPFRLKNAADCVWTGANWLCGFLWSACQKIQSHLFTDMHYAAKSPRWRRRTSLLGRTHSTWRNHYLEQRSSVRHRNRKTALHQVRC